LGEHHSTRGQLDLRGNPDRSICARDHDDCVLAVGVDVDERSTRRRIDGDQSGSVDTFSLEDCTQTRASVVIADATHEGRLGAHTRARHGLIETLTARVLGVAGRDQRLPGSRQLLHRRNEIEVRTPDDHDVELG
jgi:hypothetical protein